jgi:hypothetical protein
MRNDTQACCDGENGLPGYFPAISSYFPLASQLWPAAQISVKLGI